MGRSILGILLLVGIVFSAFAATEGIVMAHQPPAKALALGVPVLSVTKTDTLFNDADGDGVPSPGDTLRYEITIVNNTPGVDAEDVVFSDTPDGNTTLVAGSVQTTHGTITSGNTGIPPVTVDIGTVTGLDIVVIRFNVTINGLLPPGVSQVVNQGSVSGSNFPVELSDDPGDPGAGDPTITLVTIPPMPVGGDLSMVDRGSVLRANLGLLLLPLAALVMIIGIIGLVAIRRQPPA